MSNELCHWVEYDCQSYCEGSTNFCGSHNSEIRKREKNKLKGKVFSPIRKVSSKQAKSVSEYSKEKGPWIDGQICQRCFTHLASEVHHKRGRTGFADLWARARNITLLMDKRLWLAVCRDCHEWIEKNPTLAREQGFSQARNENSR